MSWKILKNFYQLISGSDDFSLFPPHHLPSSGVEHQRTQSQHSMTPGPISSCLYVQWTSAVDCSISGSHSEIVSKSLTVHRSDCEQRNKFGVQGTAKKPVLLEKMREEKRQRDDQEGPVDTAKTLTLTLSELGSHEELWAEDWHELTHNFKVSHCWE